MNKRITSLMLAAIIFVSAVLITGCIGKTPGSEADASASPTAADTAEPAGEPTQEVTEAPAVTDEPTVTEEPVVTEEPGPAYEYDPHPYVPTIAEDVPQEYWEALYNLSDALRAGETTFECASEAAYKWATDPSVLTQLLPAACVKIKAQGSDGSAPYENGVGRIYYQIPIDEFLERQEAFETLVEDVLNTCLEPDDDEFEKTLKLFRYIAINYNYNYDFIENMDDGSVYHTIMARSGQCIDLASVFSFFLLQAGVEAMQVGGSAPDMDHAWTYLVLNGKGYYSDVTWSLVSEDGCDPIPLCYFLMTTERRAKSGFYMTDLMVPLLPKYWAEFSNAEFIADDEDFMFPPASFFTSIDEESKTVHYRCEGEEREFRYAR